MPENAKGTSAINYGIVDLLLLEAEPYFIQKYVST